MNEHPTQSGSRRSSWDMVARESRVLKHERKQIWKGPSKADCESQGCGRRKCHKHKEQTLPEKRELMKVAQDDNARSSLVFIDFGHMSHMTRAYTVLADKCAYPTRKRGWRLKIMSKCYCFLKKLAEWEKDAEWYGDNAQNRKWHVNHH